MDAEREAAVVARIPLGYVAEAEEQASVILFLASDDARYVHGAIVDANGRPPLTSRRAPPGPELTRLMTSTNPGPVGAAR